MSVNQNTRKHTREPIYSEIGLFDLNSRGVAVGVSICQPCNELVSLPRRLLGKGSSPLEACSGM